MYWNLIWHQWSKYWVIILSRIRIPCILGFCSQIRPLLWGRPIDPVLAAAAFLDADADDISATNFSTDATLSDTGGGRIRDHSTQSLSLLIKIFFSILCGNAHWGWCAEWWEGCHLPFLVANLLITYNDVCVQPSFCRSLPFACPPPFCPTLWV